MRMRNCGKRRAGVSVVILNLPPRPEAPRRGLEGRSSMRRPGAAFWSILRDAKLCFAPQDEVRDARLLLCVALAALIVLFLVPRAAAQDRAPLVSPDRIEDA